MERNLILSRRNSFNFMNSVKFKELLFSSLNQLLSFPKQQVNNVYNACTKSFQNQLGRAIGTLLAPGQITLLESRVASINEFFAKQAV